MSCSIPAGRSFWRRVAVRIRRALASGLLVPAAAALVLAGGGPVAAQAPEPGLVVLALPATSWGVGLGLQDFVITASRTRPDGARSIAAERPAANMFLSALIVPAPAGDSARACRDAFWQRLKDVWQVLKDGPGKASYRDVRQSEAGDMASTDYVIEEMQGLRIDQRHLHTYFARDGSCIEVHLSKTLFEPNDEELFASVLRTVRLLDISSAPAGPVARTYRVSRGDAVALMVPPPWQDDFPGGRGNAGPTLTLTPATTKDISFVMTVLVPPPGRRDGSYNTPDALRKRTEAAAQGMLAEAVESKLEIDEIKGPEMAGFLFTATDKKPTLGPGEFRRITHAQAALRDVMLSVSLFSQAPGTAEYAAALEVLKSARLLAAPL